MKKCSGGFHENTILRNLYILKFWKMIGKLVLENHSKLQIPWVLKFFFLQFKRYEKKNLQDRLGIHFWCFSRKKNFSKTLKDCNAQGKNEKRTPQSQKCLKIFLGRVWIQTNKKKNFSPQNFFFRHTSTEKSSKWVIFFQCIFTKKNQNFLKWSVLFSWPVALQRSNF